MSSNRRRSGLGNYLPLLLALAICVLFGSGGHSSIADEQQLQEVRRLKLGSFPQRAPDAPAGPVLKSREELRQFVGQQAFDELIPQVDFAAQDVVAMQYETAGPPFGVPVWKVTEDGDVRTIEFSVREPDIGPGEARGQALKLGLDFFAVPKGSRIKIR